MRSDQSGPEPKCGHWIGTERRRCHADENIHRYTTGYRCPAHTPAAIAGRPEPPSGPGWPAHRQENDG